MAIYTISDLHLSLGADKPMDQFAGWHGYVDKIRDRWMQIVGEQDTVILPGDFSWGMNLTEALPDFQMIDALAGKKILLKGNHDYWWTSLTKIRNFWMDNGIGSCEVLQNNALLIENKIICGARGWFFEEMENYSEKIANREVLRLEMSLKDALRYGEGERIVFLHFPPLFGDKTVKALIELMRDYRVKRCYYGHLHGHSLAGAYNGSFQGIAFHCVSADFVDFRPVLIEP